MLAHDAEAGQELYSRKRLKPGSGFTASPWAYNGQVFVLSEDGDTYVLLRGLYDRLRSMVFVSRH